MVAFLDLNWNPKWTSTVGYSMIDIDNSDGQADSAFKKGQYALANILYYPTPSVFIGPGDPVGQARELPRRLHLGRLQGPGLRQVQLQALPGRQVMSERKLPSAGGSSPPPSVVLGLAAPAA